MKPYEVLTVGGCEYNLKITAAHAVSLEETIGTDLITGMEKFPEVKTLAQYYLAAAKTMNDSIKKVEVVDFEELGMEAVRKIYVENFPAFIIVDDKGNDFFADFQH